MNKSQNPRFPGPLTDEVDVSDLEAVWTALEVAHENAPIPSERTDEAWLALSGKLGLEGGSADADSPFTRDVRSGSGRARSIRTPWLRAAAAVAVLIGGLTVWQQIPVTYSAPVGGRLSVSLPDGSTVELNAGAELSHRRGFEIVPGIDQGRRVVRLRGEAFFDVTSAERPFEVEAGPARVMVLGTRFNVRARTEGDAIPSVRVEVEEGLVRVVSENTAANTELRAGESVRVEAGSTELSPDRVPVGRIAAWRTGGLTVSDEPLSAVGKELAVRFGVDVTLAPSVDGSVRVTAYYALLTGVDSVLMDLATQQNLRVRRTSTGWELY